MNKADKLKENWERGFTNVLRFTDLPSVHDVITNGSRFEFSIRAFALRAFDQGDFSSLTADQRDSVEQFLAAIDEKYSCRDTFAVHTASYPEICRKYQEGSPDFITVSYRVFKPNESYAYKVAEYEAMLAEFRATPQTCTYCETNLVDCSDHEDFDQDIICEHCKETLDGNLFERDGF